MIKALAIVPLAAGTWLLGAWFTMLLIGVVHAQWIPFLPTIGYTTAIVISALTGTSMLVRVGLVTTIQAVLKK